MSTNVEYSRSNSSVGLRTGDEDISQQNAETLFFRRIRVICTNGTPLVGNSIPDFYSSG